jgi:DNA-binding response OmpR family regulator
MKNLKTNFKKHLKNYTHLIQKPEILIGGDYVTSEMISEIKNMGMEPIKSSGSNVVSFSLDLNPDCIVLNYKNAVDAIVPLVKILKLKPYAKIIVAAENLNLSDAMEIIDIGAYDCLISPFDFKELEWRITEGISETFFSNFHLKTDETNHYITI